MRSVLASLERAAALLHLEKLFRSLMQLEGTFPSSSPPPRASWFWDVECLGVLRDREVPGPRVVPAEEERCCLAGRCH